MKHVEELRAYCLAKPGTTESFPFDEETLVFKVMGKMFALVPLERTPPQVNLKCEPDRALELREAYPDQVGAGYHMSKKHWNTVVYDRLDPHLTRAWIDHSYARVVDGLPKKTQRELRGMGADWEADL